MRVVPRNKSPQIMFYLTHVPKWVENAAALGLDPALLASLQARVDAAREAYNAQRIAQAKAQAATLGLRNALDKMNVEGAGLIKQIRARTATLGNQAYSLAFIPAPDKASPIAPPGTPHSFQTELTAIGTLILSWKCKNPRGARGTLYNIHRRIVNVAGEQGPMEFLGIAGRKTFTDATLPPGVRHVTYQVQAFRSTRLGLLATHSLSFSAPRGMPMQGTGTMQLAA